MKQVRLLVVLALAAFAFSAVPGDALAAPQVARIGSPAKGRRHHKKAKRIRKKRRRSARSHKGLEF